ncbi:MAG: putative glycoside hydrolase [Bacteroides sp.]|nr:putative glycoside hydrolase [Prevotella sp.]MCM1407684.1 putative glycoside hydrolase [Treponema brennaborense]MCM1469166.1 putative glycoside hydrolase [Bacteroides sp.]
MKKTNILRGMYVFRNYKHIQKILLSADLCKVFRLFRGCKAALCFALLAACLPSFFAQTQAAIPPQMQTAAAETPFPLVGTEFGLFRITDGGNIPLWTDAAVYKIVRTAQGYYLLTENGIYFSADLREFEPRNEGLPFLTIKKYDGTQKTFEKQFQMLKDLKAHPQDPSVLVTAVRNAVFLTRDGGLSWKSLGFSAKTMGLKSVAVATMPPNSSGAGGLAVFMSHSMYGLSYILPDASRPQWIDIKSGFEILPTLSSPDEIADILPVVQRDESGAESVEIYLTQTFIPRLYRLNWQTMRGELLWNGGMKNATYDGLVYLPSSDGSPKLMCARSGGFSKFDLQTHEMTDNAAAAFLWKKYIDRAEYHPNCAYFYRGMTSSENDAALSELWLLYPDVYNTKYGTLLTDKKCLYIPPYQASVASKLEEHIATIKKNKLNGAVIDMKDDYGYLRYDTKDPLVLEKGMTSRYAVQLESMISRLKKENLYLIARLVVFKDKTLAGYKGKKYAVWDSRRNDQWLGIKGYTQVKDDDGAVIRTETNYYDEVWVDPYCEEVWEYNIAVARELIARGFDEIQFDYIRFPTDGRNIQNAQYRWRDKSMDMESALISFLSYAREHLDAPIGIDIYGANGWYRSGARTGQDVELLARYVDLIHPMLYPSHFEQPFLAYQPASERPYRVYYFGTYRNTVIGRHTVIVRPWVQAFYLPVSYDKQYYNADYVRREVFGVRDSVNNGYLYWNNSGRYDDISADPEETEPYLYNGGEPHR